MSEEAKTIFINSEKEPRFEEILENSVLLFRQTGLDDLAIKWDLILNNYRTMKDLPN